ncbi:MAG TPA: class I tRNA ligase family protein, partial [Candidatus Methanoperedenaceae archaeon]|nr:class I tRNA ligase family protein [Candidatus Methanoperedenaceae archaeon]
LESVRDSLIVVDRWILSRLNSLINSVDESMRTYMLHRAVRAISDFVLEDLSRWYVQLIRPRTWIEADDPDKLAAYRVMYDVLVTLSKILAPFAPYISECMYRNLAAELEGRESVHFCDWVKSDASLIDTGLEAQMNTIREITEAASNARQKSKRKLRWPVRRIVIAPKTDNTIEAVRMLETVLREQTNAKSIVVLGRGEAWDELSIEIIPNFTALGPVFKKDAGKVAAALKELDGKELKRTLAGGSATLATKAGEITITGDMVSFKDSMPKDIAAAEFPDGAVYVDTSVTDDIEAEGYAREVLRRLQEMRKEMDLEVDMEVAAYVLVKDPRVSGLLAGWKEFIGHEARACTLTLDSDIHVEGELVRDWDVEGVEMKMGLKRGTSC